MELQVKKFQNQTSFGMVFLYKKIYSLPKRRRILMSNKRVKGEEIKKDNQLIKYQPR